MLIHLLAQATENQSNGVNLSLQQLLLGYGPLGVFAVFVGLDKIGTHSERNLLRIRIETKDQHILDMHSKIEDDILPVLTQSLTNNQEATKLLAEAAKALTDSAEVIRQYTDPPRNRPRRDDRDD